MKKNWIEWIPNISVGRNTSLIKLIDQSFDQIPNLFVLHKDVGWDANRTVYTMVGNTQSLWEAIFSLIELLEIHQTMEVHKGEHPRIGALDVSPFVALGKTSVDELIQWSMSLANEISSQFNLPIYLYEKSCQIDNRKNLAQIRKGEYEGLSDKIQSPEWKPDYGSEFNPILGATVIGIRDFLVAFNVNIETKDLSIAKKIAKSIRSAGPTGRKYALPSLKAIGWYMNQYEKCQISTNLTNIEETDIFEVFNQIQTCAKEYNIDVASAELIGLIPIQMVQRIEKKWNIPSADQAQAMGLAFCGIDDIEKRTIEYNANLVSNGQLFN